ncbi:MAG: tRNA dihydrouridine synthase DusB [Deltaproteobacteria bacterium]|nr:tRNA dihydrouridine synthase DusB [Deltaproteobacteria bacterium]
MFHFDKQRTFLAPLAGFSDSPFRRICRKLGADAVFTEMVNAIGLTSPLFSKTKRRYVYFLPPEKPIGIQLFGNDPGIMADAASIGEELGFDFVDINMGCPMKKILKTGSGALLMRDIRRASMIVKRVKNNIRIPLSVKIRTGWDEQDNSYVDFASSLADSGADAIAVHPRTVSQGMEGKADHGKTAAICKMSTAPHVIASGGIETARDAVLVREMSGCDAIMVGRGALRNPLIFSEIRQFMNGTSESEFPGLADVILDHFDQVYAFYGEKAPTFFRKQITWYTRDLPGSAGFRRRISKVNDSEEMKSEIESYFKKHR